MSDVNIKKAVEIVNHHLSVAESMEKSYKEGPQDKVTQAYEFACNQCVSVCNDILKDIKKAIKKNEPERLSPLSMKIEQFERESDERIENRNCSGKIGLSTFKPVRL